MLDLTKQERLVLLWFLAVVAAGSVLRTIAVKSPAVTRALDFFAEDRLTRKIDLNAATDEELRAIPRVGPVTAQRIIAHRQEKGGFRSLEELQDVPGIGPGLYQQLAPFLRIASP